MNIFVARQPIFDRSQSVYGYELLFREGFNSLLSENNGDRATSTVLTNSFFLIGIESLTSGKRAFINFTRNLLLREVATTFPTHQIAVEVLETIRPDGPVLNACRRLKDAGYILALDDFAYQPEFIPLIELADIIKVDFLATPIPERRRLVQELRNGRIRFLAEKVETKRDFEMALDFGYSYIQGYFFSRPDIVTARDIPGYKLNYLHTLYEINRPEIDIDVLDRIISHDLSLSYKLLRFINSAFFGLRHRIHSIRHALVLLGQDEIRKWASLVTLTGMGEDKPHELAVLATVRAKFCELVARRIGRAETHTDMYLMGLFSLVDAFTDRPLAEILAQLPIADEAKQALLGETSSFSDIYHLVLAYEEADWQAFGALAARLGLPESAGPEIYRQAVHWANQIFLH